MSDGVHSSKAAEPVGKFPHAKRVGNLLFISGIGPRERGTKKIPGVELSADGTVASYDIETQVHSVFRNVRLILEEVGLGLSDLVDVQVFLTDMKKDFPVMNRLWAEYFPQSAPCRTTVEVGALPTPIAVELKCIAVFGEGKA
ncbi:MAG: RidA family protein [Oligoflexia bacterium]